MTGRSRVLHILARPLLAVASVLLVLGFAELALRVATPASSGARFLYTTESPLYRVMRPSHLVHPYGVPFRTNELGFRDDRDEVPPRRGGERRIVVLGDSFTACAGVPFEQVFTELVEAELARADPTRPIAVFNLGVGGYNPQHYLLVLRGTGLALEPDGVVVALYVPNDFVPWDRELDAKRARGEAQPPHVPWRHRSYLLRVIGPELKALARSALLFVTREPADSPARKRALPSSSPGWSANAAALVEIARTARAHGVPVLILLMPAVADFEAQAPAHRELASFCEQHGLDCVDTLPRFIADGRSPWSFALHLVDKHPNPAYNEIVAEELSRALLERADAWHLDRTPPAG